jgi:VanZ family protein
VKTAAWFLKYWLPVLLWMSLIFGFSTDVGSSSHTSRIIGPILRWLIPDISDAAIERVQLVVRKGAHLTEYAILGALAWRAVRQPRREDQRPWQMRYALAAVAIATLFAASDEWHQSTVPSRQGQVSDVFIDGLGASAGLVAVWWIGRQLKRW